MNTAYQVMIREILASGGQIGRYDPRHVEAWMRSEHGTLDALSRGRFASEVRIAAQCIDEAGVSVSESLAKSEGL